MKPRRLLLPLTVLATANSTFAALNTYQWNGTTNTTWATTTNWTGGTVAATNGTFDARLNVYDGAGSNLVYDFAGITTTYANSAAASRGLVIGNTASSNGSTFEIKAGTFSTAGSTAADLIANVGTSALVSTLYLNGGNYTSSATGLILGNSIDTGVLTLDATNGGTATITTLQLGGAGGVGVSTINLNGGTLAVNTITSGNASQTRNFSFNGGILQARTSTATFITATALPTATVKAGGAKIDTQTNTVEIASVLAHDSGLGATADGGLTKSGTGILTLSGTNTFTGATAINAGALLITNTSALGTTGAGTSVAVNAALALSGGINYSSAESVTLTGPGLTAASGVFASVQRGSLQSVSGTNTFAGNISFTDNGNTRIGVQNGASLVLTGNITESVANSSLIFRHSTTGVGNITLSGTGNSWTGNTDIYGGEGAVILGVDNAIPATSLLRVGTTNVGTASTLDMNGKVQTVKGISQVFAGSNGVITNNGTTDSLLTLASLSTNQDYSGVIKNGASNKVALTLNSSGKTQTLSGANTYTGATTVTAGTLVVNGSLGNTTTTIGSGGTLKGTGSLGGTVGVSGTLAPGNSIGTLNFSQTLSLTGISDFEIDPTLGLGVNSDLANVTGAVTYGGTLNVLYGGSNANFTSGMVFNLFNGASFTGSFSTINLPDLTGTGLSWQNDLATDGSLTVIPEPAAVLLGGVGLVALLRRRRD